MKPELLNKTLAFLGCMLLATAAPAWETIGCAIILLFLFSSYWTAVLSGAVIDVLYSPHGLFLGSAKFTIIMIAIAAVVYFLKKRLIFYRPGISD